MAAVKTAISMDEDLFEQVETLAQEMKLPRSRVIVLALRDYLKRREGRRITEQLNAVYGEDYEMDPKDKLFLEAANRHMAEILKAEEDEW